MSFETKVIIDTFLRKPISIVYSLSFVIANHTRSLILQADRDASTLHIFEGKVANLMLQICNCKY